MKAQTNEKTLMIDTEDLNTRYKNALQSSRSQKEIFTVFQTLINHLGSI